MTRTTRGNDRRVPAYTCIFHHTRGNAVCPVTIHQPMDVVHGAFTDYLRNTALTPAVVEMVLDAIRAEVAPSGPDAVDVKDAGRLETRKKTTSASE